MQNNAPVKSKEQVKFTSIVEAVAANVGKTLVWIIISDVLYFLQMDFINKTIMGATEGVVEEEGMVTLVCTMAVEEETAGENEVTTEVIEEAVPTVVRDEIPV